MTRGAAARDDGRHTDAPPLAAPESRQRRSATPSVSELAAEVATAAWASDLPRLEREYRDARTFLLYEAEFTFFGRLAFSMRPHFTRRVKTAAIRADLALLINPDFWARQNLGQRAFLIAHEALHIMLLAFSRCGARDHDRWNRAQDFVINLWLADLGLPLPAGVCLCYDPKYRGWSDGRVYDDLEAEDAAAEAAGRRCRVCGQGTPADASEGSSVRADARAGAAGAEEGDAAESCPSCGQPVSWERGLGQWGGDVDLEQTAELERQATEGQGYPVLNEGMLRAMIVQAAQQADASSHGQLPAFARQWITSWTDPRLDFRTYLKRQVAPYLVDGTSYDVPSRRSGALRQVEGLPRGVVPILPGPEDGLPDICLVLDTSGSRWKNEYAAVDLGEFYGWVRRAGRKTRIIQCDAAIQADVYARRPADIAFRTGGGGTDFRPIFTHLRATARRRRWPAAIFIFTDLAGTMPDVAARPPRGVDVFWVCVDDTPPSELPPFGAVILRPLAPGGAVRVLRALRDRTPVT